MLCFMRALEIHVLETASDIDLALSVGVLLPEQLMETVCSRCGEEVGHLNGDDFTEFCVVIDDEDRDWIVCTECSASVIDGDVRQATERPETYSGTGNSYGDDDDFDFFY